MKHIVLTLREAQDVPTKTPAMKPFTIKLQNSIREEELKNRIAAMFFGKYDCTRIVGNIDFCLSNPISFYDDLGSLPKSTNKTKTEKWQSVRLPWQHEFHTYNCIEFGRKGTKDEYVKHFNGYTFRDLPTSRRSYFSYSLVDRLGMNSDTKACWCLDLVPIKLEKRVEGKNEVFRFSAFVRLLDKHPCCDSKEIHMGNLEGRWITITY